MLNPDKPPIDARDEVEHAAIREILRELPGDHPAWQAYLGGVDTIKLSHLLVDRRDLVERLTRAFLDGIDRAMRRGSHFKP